MTTTGSPQLCRSFLTSPAATTGENSSKYLESTFTKTGFEVPDWFSPDLEDATAPTMKEEGLNNIINTLSNYESTYPGEVWPRIQWAYDDREICKQGEQQVRTLVEEVGEQLAGFTVPKVGRLENVQEFANLLSDIEDETGLDHGRIEMNIIVETAPAMSDLRKIAKFGGESRIAGLTFGPGDYTFDCGGRLQNGSLPEWPGVREAITREASANGLMCIGGIFAQIYSSSGGVRFYNGDGFAQNAMQDVKLGFDGSWCLHPQQTIQANRLHMPSREDLEEYLETIIELNEADGAGSMLVGGGMIDVGGLKYYLNEIQSAVAISEAREEQAHEMYGQDLLARAEKIANADVDRALDLADVTL